MIHFSMFSLSALLIHDFTFFTWSSIHQFTSFYLSIHHFIYSYIYLYLFIHFYFYVSTVGERHATWYSWGIGALTGSVYTFGFVLMCPQVLYSTLLFCTVHPLLSFPLLSLLHFLYTQLLTLLPYLSSLLPLLTSIFTLNLFSFVFLLLFYPQLFINHKLKSVSHLPWKFLIFRFLNTFIDDLFAFGKLQAVCN